MTWAIVLVPALIGWISAPESSLGWLPVAALASGLWFLGHGQTVGAAGLTVSVVPLLLLLAFVLVARRAVRRLVAAERPVARASEWDRVLLRRLVPGFLLGYAAVTVLVGLTSLAGTLRPGPAGVVGALLVPLVATALGTRAEGARHWASASSSLARLPILSRVRGRLAEMLQVDTVERPAWLAAAWRAAWRGALVLLALGLLLAVGRIAVSLPAVTRLHGQYDLNVAAAAVLLAGELLLLGNFATWGAAFLAGPGFSVAVGSTISPAGAHPGLMPLVPVLGALPREANYPPALFLVVLLPVAVGALVGWWVDRRRRDEAGAGERLGAAAASGVIAVALVGLVTALANGSVGADRLRSVGPTVGPMVGALLLEVLGGAAVCVCYRVWRARRADQAPQPTVVSAEAEAEGAEAEGWQADGAEADQEMRPAALGGRRDG